MPVTKEEAPLRTFKKTYLVAFFGRTDATEVVQVLLQCIIISIAYYQLLAPKCEGCNTFASGSSSLCISTWCIIFFPQML